MDKDPSDTFSGKVLLLLIDKIAIGGIIALVLLGYSIWQTRDQRSYDEKITLSFKRAEYIKELAPMVVDQKNDPISRAQALFALIETNSISDKTAFVLTGRLLRSGFTLSDRPFVVEVNSAMGKSEKYF